MPWRRPAPPVGHKRFQELITTSPKHYLATSYGDGVRNETPQIWGIRGQQLHVPPNGGRSNRRGADSQSARRHSNGLLDKQLRGSNAVPGTGFRNRVWEPDRERVLRSWNFAKQSRVLRLHGIARERGLSSGPRTPARGSDALTGRHMGANACLAPEGGRLGLAVGPAAARVTGVRSPHGGGKKSGGSKGNRPNRESDGLGGPSGDLKISPVLSRCRWSHDPPREPRSGTASNPKYRPWRRAPRVQPSVRGCPTTGCPNRWSCSHG